MKRGDIFQFGNFRIDPLSRAVMRDDSPVALNRRAFDVLLYLVQNPGRVVDEGRTAQERLAGCIRG